MRRAQAFFHVITYQQLVSYSPLKELPRTLAAEMAGPSDPNCDVAEAQVANSGSVHSEHAFEKCGRAT